MTPETRERWLVLIKTCESTYGLDYVERQVKRKGLLDDRMKEAIVERRNQIRDERDRSPF